MLSIRTAAPALLVFTCLILAGCTTDAEPGSDDLTLQQTAPGAENATVNNTLPTLSLVTNVTEGEAPLLVTLEIDGADEDGDALQWAVYLLAQGAADGAVGNESEAGDEGDAGNQSEAEESPPVPEDAEPIHEGTGLPATVNTTIETPGNHSLVVVVDDGTDPVYELVVVTVLEGAPADPNAGLPEPQFIAGEAKLPSALQASGQGCAEGWLNIVNPAPQSIDGEYRPLPEDVDEWKWTLTSGFTLYFWGDDGIGSAQQEAGTIPAGSTDVDICSDDQVMADYELRMTHPDWVDL